MKLRFALLTLILPLAGMAQTVNIIPQPASLTLTKGRFVLKRGSFIITKDASLADEAHYLKKQLYSSNKMQLNFSKNAHHGIILRLSNDNKDTAGSYQLVINKENVLITSSTKEGIFYGIQSLLQIAGNHVHPYVTLPGLTIDDSPRYQWRGFMLDESRHFFGKQKVEMLLDWMARYKLNKFHWHLTDAHGWRIQINKYPKLTTVGGVGNFTDSLAAAKFYTQDAIRQIVAYAKERFITVIPEIDMPGHATASNKAYPEYSGGVVAKYPNFTFDPSTENTYPFLADILKKTNALFPSGMIHLGGDEVSLGMQAWAGRPSIMEMMAKNNFTSLTDLEFYFFKRMADTVIKLNDKILCWDEATGADLPADKTI